MVEAIRKVITFKEMELTGCGNGKEQCDGRTSEEGSQKVIWSQVGDFIFIC